MKPFKTVVATAMLAACVSQPSLAQNEGETVIVSTLAGGGATGDVDTYGGGDFADGQGSAARFNEPTGIVIDAAGNLYVADSWNSSIRKVKPNGEVTTLAGNGKRGEVDGQGNAAYFHVLAGITIDAAGNLYVTDLWSGHIRKVTPEGKVSTLAGDKWVLFDRQGSITQFGSPRGIAIDAVGNLYVVDGVSRGRNFTSELPPPGHQSEPDIYRIYKVTPEGNVSTLAGGRKGFADGRGSAARFGYPTGIAIDAAGNLYVADRGNHRIRKVTPEGEVSTLAGGEQGFADGQGNAARFFWPDGIAIDAAGNLYVADMGNHRIRKVTPDGTVSTLAGSGPTGYDNGGFADGEGSAARFNSPTGIAIDTVGNLYVADSKNHRIRKIEFRRP